MGQRLYVDLTNAGITPFISMEEQVQAALEQYARGELKDYPDKQCDPHDHH